MELTSAIRGQDHGRWLLSLDRPDLRHGHLKVREHLKQEGLELVVSAIDLVDQQNRAVARSQRRQQRSLDQKARAKQPLDALDQDRAPERQSQIQAGGQTTIGDVALFEQRLAQVVRAVE